MTAASVLRLGLIGDNIRASRAPDLHRHAGALCGIDVRYDLMIPPAMVQTFGEVFELCHATLRGINVTLPYKERVVGMVRVGDAEQARIGAVNTVLFEDDGPRGFNTDYTGFMAAFRHGVPGAPGAVCVIGAGGVGRAVAFALLDLGATEVRLVDRDLSKAEALAKALRAAERPAPVVVTGDLAAALDGAEGVLNCTPWGMVGYGRSPVPDAAFPRARWAFDAVYTPGDTRFRAQALAAGAHFLSGFELFFWQGVHAFEHFSGCKLEDTDALRRHLESRDDAF